MNSVVFCFLDKCYSSGLYFGYMKMPRVGDAVYSNSIIRTGKIIEICKRRMKVNLLIKRKR